MAGLPRRLAPQADAGHGAADGAGVLFRGQTAQALLPRQLDIDGEAVGQQPGLLHQLRGGIGNGLEVDVALEPMRHPQLARDAHHVPHRLIRRTDDAGGEEQPLDIVAPVEFQHQAHHLLDAEAGALDIGRHAVDAIGAVVDAEVRHQDLEQRDAAPVRRIGMADAHPLGRSQAPRPGIAPGRPAGGAGGVVFRGIRQDGELFHQAASGHAFMICSSPPRRNVL